MRFFNLLCLLLLVISAGSVFAQQAPKPDDVVAEVNGIKITVDDFMAELSRLNVQDQQKIASDPNGRANLVNSLIKKKLLVAQAKNLGVDTLDFVKKAIARSTEDIYAQVVLNAIQRQNSQVSDSEAQDWYSKNDTLFNLDYRYHITQIILPDENTANDVLKKLRKGKLSWNDAVKQYPGTQNNVSGDTIWIFRNNIVQQARDVIANLKKGEISDVIKIGTSYYIIKMLDFEPPRKATFDEVKDRIKQILANQKAQDAVTQYENKLMMQAKISIDNAVLNSINFNQNQLSAPASQEQRK